MTSPKVFLSYSHDSPAHKQWVLELATRLRHGGVDAIVDQWDLKLGEDIARFMEHGIQDCERVVVVLSEQYVAKANEGRGGVGYERQIVTAELIQNLGTTKFIPIIRGNPQRLIPAFLGYRAYLDFTDEVNYDLHLDVLLREIHQVPPPTRPPVGSNPYAHLVVASPTAAAAPAAQQSEEPARADTQPVRRLLEETASAMALHDWLIARAQRAKKEMHEANVFDVASKPTPEDFALRIAAIENSVTPLLPELALIGRWANAPKFSSGLRGVARLDSVALPLGSYYEAWLYVGQYPLLLASTSIGLGALIADDFGKLRDLWTYRLAESRRDKSERLLLPALHSGAPFAQDVWKWLPGKNRMHFPVSARLEETMLPVASELQLDDQELEQLIDRYEFFQALQYVAMVTPGEHFGIWAPLGAFVWRRPGLFASAKTEIDKAGDVWAPLAAGLFGGKAENAVAALNSLREFIGRVRSQRGMF